MAGPATPLRISAFIDDATALRAAFDGGAEIVVGRSTDAHFVVGDARVSRRHVRLRSQGAGWRVEDLRSKNGTRLDGSPISAADIAGDCWLSLGGVPIRIELLSKATMRREAELLASKRALAETALAGAADPATIFETALKTALELSGCARASIWSIAPNGEFAVKARIGADAPPESRGAMRAAIDGGAPVVTHDIAGIAALAARESVVGGRMRALICLPLDIDGAPRAVLYADSPAVGKNFTALDVDLMSALARQASIAFGASLVRDAIAGLR